MGENYIRNAEESKYIQTSSKYGLDLKDATPEDDVSTTPDRNQKMRALKVAIVEQRNLHNKQKQLHVEFETVETRLRETQVKIENLLSQWNKLEEELDNLDEFLQILLDDDADINNVKQIIDIIIRKQNVEQRKTIRKYSNT